MKDFSSETGHETSVLKITVFISVIALLCAGIGYLWITGENAKKADTYFAKAQDSCEHDYLDTCLSQVNQALQLREKSEYYRLKFNALNSQDKTYESKQVLEKLLQMEPDNAHYHYLMRRLAELSGDENLEFKSIDTAIRLQPNNGDYQITKAAMLVERNRQKEAVPIYEQLIVKQPHYYHYWDQYALSYSNAEMWPQALAIRQRGLRLNPDDYLQYFGMGCLYDRMGKKQDSVLAYRHSLELHPLSNSIAARRIFELTGKRVPPVLEDASSDSLPIETEANLSFVTADINGVKGRFLLDTGASISVIFKGKASKYKLMPLEQVVSAETANGFTQAPLTYGNLRLGRHDLEYARFALLKDLSNQSVDGIIGMDILGLFRFEIDRGTGLLTLQNQ